MAYPLDNGKQLSGDASHSFVAIQTGRSSLSCPEAACRFPDTGMPEHFSPFPLDPGGSYHFSGMWVFSPTTSSKSPAIRSPFRQVPPRPHCSFPVNQRNCVLHPLSPSINFLKFPHAPHSTGFIPPPMGALLRITGPVGLISPPLSSTPSAVVSSV